MNNNVGLELYSLLISSGDDGLIGIVCNNSHYHSTLDRRLLEINIEDVKDRIRRNS